MELNKKTILLVLFWIAISCVLCGIFGYVRLTEFPNSLPLFLLSLMAPMGLLIAFLVLNEKNKLN